MEYDYYEDSAEFIFNTLIDELKANGSRSEIQLLSIDALSGYTAATIQTALEVLVELGDVTTQLNWMKVSYIYKPRRVSRLIECTNGCFLIHSVKREDLRKRIHTVLTDHGPKTPEDLAKHLQQPLFLIQSMVDLLILSNEIIEKEGMFSIVTA
jgi:hypothetical protein